MVDQWYLDIAGLGARSPEFVRWFSAFATDAIIGVFPVMFVVVWWRARHRQAAAMARAIAAPVLAVVAYVVSEVVKNIWQEDRPCRVLGDVATIVTCPEFGDWSFPSNHATVAGAAAAGILWSSRNLGIVAAGLAVLAALSRVFVGAHYPHDVLAGLLLGVALAAFVPPLARAMTPVVARVRTR
ncbi:phosphatase PAP2 family protein [Kibdelosporangium persicum]|uniref:Undecaprenyl-diphosphate phosphatase n=1 Tax=Kibdelosporangium persicum TaxID=2698649 RepID=A0ABX2F098_9PSEU|nr:phosphatase PAP2 family protein [Kibdelosporangium persicum]NRN64677.1 Undecaprenyl-diphosphate phosphatase [Kibdelosporangium persicum]